MPAMRLTANTIEREPREGGFSLIEVLIAAGLLVGSLAALAFVFVFATRANANAQHATYATVLAMQKMEELRAAGARPFRWWTRLTTPTFAAPCS